MTLKNLEKIGRLEAFDASPEEVQRLLLAAKRSLEDAKLRQLSADSKFDLAYRSIVQSGLAALAANGYRPLKSVPGHHMTIIQSLPKSIGIDPGRVVILDMLRKKRNLTDYTGAPVDSGSVRECRNQAAALVDEVEAWIRANKAYLLAED